MSQSEQLILSATAVVLRDAPQGFEVLLLRRNQAIKLHGGSWVFPGGKADSADIPKSINKSDLSDLSESEKERVSRLCASRESFEEAGLKLYPEQLKFCSRWITPEAMKKRFDAFFFVCSVDHQATVLIDEGEILDYTWCTPAEALRKQAHGELTLPPPTYVTLVRLMDYKSCEEAIHALSNEPVSYRPKLNLTNTGFHSIYEEDAEYQEASLVFRKPAHRLIVDSGKFTYICDL